jgi:hypothetical protein
MKKPAAPQVFVVGERVRVEGYHANYTPTILSFRDVNRFRRVVLATPEIPGSTLEVDEKRLQKFEKRKKK